MESEWKSVQVLKEIERQTCVCMCLRACMCVCVLIYMTYGHSSVTLSASHGDQRDKTAAALKLFLWLQSILLTCGFQMWSGDSRGTLKEGTGGPLPKQHKFFILKFPLLVSQWHNSLMFFKLLKWTSSASLPSGSRLEKVAERLIKVSAKYKKKSVLKCSSVIMQVCACGMITPVNLAERNAFTECACVCV